MGSSSFSTCGIHIVQAIPGYIQLQFLSLESQLLREIISQKLALQVGIHAIHSDATTGNLIIIFEPQILSLPMMLELLKQLGVNEDIQTLPSSTTLGMQMGSFLRHNHKLEALLPMVAGMLITDSLKLKGGWAILSNIVAASITHQAIEHLEGMGISSQSVVETTEAESSESSEIPPENTSDTLSVIQNIPGRLRLRIPYLTQANYTKQLQQLLSADERITSIRFNIDAASVVVTYPKHLFTQTEMLNHVKSVINSCVTPTASSDTDTNIDIDIKTPEEASTVVPEDEVIDNLQQILKPSFGWTLFNVIARRFSPVPSNS